jgi:hypothetical protein
MPRNVSKTVRKIMMIVSIAAGLICGLTMSYEFVLDIEYVNYPRVPEPEKNRTIPHQVKSAIIYMSEIQSDELTTIHWIEIISGVIFLIALVMKRKR